MMLRYTAALIALMIVSDVSSAQVANGRLSAFGAVQPMGNHYVVETGSEAGLQVSSRLSDAYVALQARESGADWGPAFETGVTDADGGFSRSYEVPRALAGAELEFRALIFDRRGHGSPTSTVRVVFRKGDGATGSTEGPLARRLPMDEDIDKKWMLKMQALGLGTSRQAPAGGELTQDIKKQKKAPSDLRAAPSGDEMTQDIKKQKKAPSDLRAAPVVGQLTEDIKKQKKASVDLLGEFLRLQVTEPGNKWELDSQLQNANAELRARKIREATASGRN